MPQLPQEAQAAAEQADSRAPLDEGIYVLRLRDVDGSGSGPSGPYWKWEFEVAHHQAPSVNGRRLWTNTSLSKKAAWKLKEVFDAYGVGLDTDTDEMCGELCLGSITQEVIQTGKRAGDIGNSIDMLMPLPEDYELFDDDTDANTDYDPRYEAGSSDNGADSSEEPF